jgi:para-nitrobenzyl esterase
MDAPVAESANGRLLGKWTPEGDVALFRGIPYAAPPLGPLRFRPPQAPADWAGQRDATRYGPSAPQNPGTLERLMGGQSLRTDEDCLTLNVWTPAADAGKRPVMVWIHGGAFVTGSGSTPWYDGRNFVRSGDAVFVSINYRLGALGFLHLGDLAGEAYASSGNCGLLDQIAALRWVRDNIGGFGGDPGNVTVFGESAGAMSVATLLGLPAARGLFARAIIQSGSCRFVSTRERATAIANETLAPLGVGAADLARLVEMPLTQLLAAQEAVYTKHAAASLPYQPVIDGVVLPEPPLDAVAAGSAAGVPVLCGTTSEEMKLFTLMDSSLASSDEASLLARAAEVFGTRAEEALAVYRQERPDATNAEVWTAVATDAIFRIPAIRLLEAQLSNTPDCWSYLFTMRSTAFGGALGACHALEIPFVFANLDRPGVNLFIGDPPGAAALSATMHQAWVAFAKHGDPGWERYESGRRATMEFGVQSRLVDDPLGAQRRLWPR